MLRTCMTPMLSEGSEGTAIVFKNLFMSRTLMRVALPHGLRVVRTFVHRDSGQNCPGFEQKESPHE